MVAVDLEVNQPRERATIDVAFDVLAALIEGRHVVVLFQVVYGVQDFFVKAVAEAVLLAVVPVALREELGLRSWRNNGRESRIIHDSCFMDCA